ncbi:MAG: DUF4384 domain-containing protein [Pseudomonadota bacterium]
MLISLLAMLAWPAQAQDIPKELAEIYALIRSANVKLGVLEEQVALAEQEVARLQNAANRRSRDQEAIEQSSFAVGLGIEIAEHDMIESADRICRDEFLAAGNPSLSVSENALIDCADTLTLRARYNVTFDCSSVHLEALANGEIGLSGYVKAEQDLADLQAQFGTMATRNVDVLPFPACEALDVLELPLSSERRPTVSLLSDLENISFGDSLAFRVTTPDFFSFLYVVYLQADGAVVNLMPRRRLMRAQQDPNTTLYFGDGRDGRQTYTAQPPSGTEAIIAIAARSPIDALDVLEDEADGQLKSDRGRGARIDQVEFLSLLEASLQEMASQGGGRREVSAGVLHLNVIP